MVDTQQVGELKRRVSTVKKTLLGVGVASAMAMASPSLMAQDEQGVSVRYGLGDDYKRIEAAWNSRTLWSTDLFGRPLNLQAEVGLAYWHAKRSSSSSSVWQLTATPMLRYWVSERWYLEAGIGPSVFSSVKFAGKRMGTAFQFADQVGVGVRITDNQRLSLRYSHYSNASIKKPNPGLDLLQLSYTFNF